MARSRYSGNTIIDGHFYGTWRNPAVENGIDHKLIDGLVTVEHVVVSGERVDQIAARYYGESEYYWIVCLANEIMFPLDISPGDKLRIPTDLKAVLDRLQR